MLQDKDEHLELMDGVVIDLLNAKWNTFIKRKFYRQFFMFSFYFVVSLVCFTLRPGPPVKIAPKNSTNVTTATATPQTKLFNSTDLSNVTDFLSETSKLINATAENAGESIIPFTTLIFSDSILN